MRWPRVVILLVAALSLVAAACGGESAPRAPGPAQGSPTATATSAALPEATGTPSPTAFSTANPTPEATSGATPSPVATTTAAPTPARSPTPEPQPIRFTPLTRGEPRPPPGDVALYYGIAICAACDVVLSDIRRIVFDEVSGAVEEERPLAFFDQLRDGGQEFEIAGFEVSRSGQQMAAMLCYGGPCARSLEGASPDAGLHVWMSRDVGATWEDLGPVLPGAVITRVTDEDVLVREQNSRVRWLVSGEAYPPPAEPRSPTLGNAPWHRAGDRPDGAVAWVAEAEGDHLLAVADGDGDVEAVYGADGSLWGYFAADELLVRSVILLGHRFGEIRGAELLDLNSLSIHPIGGLSLPPDFDPETDGQQQEYYHLIAARPAPVASGTAQPPTEYRPLTLSDPLPLPPGMALYLRGYASCHGPEWWSRAVATPAGELLFDNPLALLPDRSGERSLGGVSASGQTLAAVLCERGVCISLDGASEDAVEALWVSDDGGGAWERWGDAPSNHRAISVVTDDDVAFALLDDPQPRAWWFRSGEALTPPEGLLTPRIWGWRDGRDGPEPLWADIEGTALVSASGAPLPRPQNFHIVAGLPDGSIFWRSTYAHEDTLGRDLFLRTSDQGEELGAYAWGGPIPLVLVDHVEEQLFVGFLGTHACKDSVRTVLVDFSSRTVHAIPGLDDAEVLIVVAARPAPH